MVVVHLVCKPIQILRIDNSIFSGWHRCCAISTNEKREQVVSPNERERTRNIHLSEFNSCVYPSDGTYFWSVCVYLLMLVFVFEFSMEFTCGFECATLCHTAHSTVRKIFQTYLHCDTFINSSDGSISSIDKWDRKKWCWHFNGLPFRDFKRTLYTIHNS